MLSRFFSLVHQLRRGFTWGLIALLGSAPGQAADSTATFSYDAAGNLIAVTRPAASTAWLTVNKSGNGTVTSSPAGINCGNTCSASFNKGSGVTLTASATTGYSFTGWSGGGCSGTGNCNLTMDADKTVTATFTPNSATRTLTVSKSGNGTVLSTPAGINCGNTCSASFNNGTGVALTANASAGYSFSGWSGSGCSGTGGCNLTMDADKSVTASFIVTPSDGCRSTKTGNGKGTLEVTSITPSPGTYSLANQAGEVDVAFNYTNNMGRNVLIFVDGTGLSWVYGSPYYPTGSGNDNTGLGVDSAGTVSCVFLYMVDANDQNNLVTEIRVPGVWTFTSAASTTLLTVNKIGSGTVTSTPAGINCGNTCSASFNNGTGVTLTANAATGYSFSGWSGGGCSGTGNCNLTMDADKTITATFTNSALPNLTPYKPSGWSDKIVVSTTTGMTTDSGSLKNTDTLFVDWAVINNSGASITNYFIVELDVDGNMAAQWLCDPLSANDKCDVTDFSMGPLSAGAHSLQILVDLYGDIDESNENDNSFTKTITITNASGSNQSADVLWRHQTSGENFAWFLNGTSLSNLSRINEVPNQNWRVTGVGDFNGDGKADLFWRQIAIGETWVYLMNGSSISAQGALTTVSDLNWRPVGVGDLNGDGRADVVWRHQLTGENFVWFMNGLGLSGLSRINYVPNQNWRIAEIGDFNHDGKADLFWRNTATGETWVYLMNGSSIAAQGPMTTVGDLNWLPVGVGDLNGDGRADIVWRHQLTGENFAWFMNGLGLSGLSRINYVPNLNWQVADVGDFNHDGKADLFWRNIATGETWVYLMNGSSISAQGPLPTVSDLNWKPVP